MMERDFEREGWVRIMPEFGGTCVWHMDGCGDTVDALPITEGLGIALQGWCAWYSMDRDASNPAEHKLDAQAHNDVGIRLARAVAASLVGWTVIYGTPRDSVDVSKRN